MRKKKRILSLLLCLCLLFSLCPQTAAAGEIQDIGFTAQGTGLCEHHPQHTDECGYTEGSEGTPCTYVCEICYPQDSGEAEDAGTEEELEHMSQDEQAAVYEQVQAACNAYNALTTDQQEQITGAEVINDLFAVFNGMAMPLATGAFNVSGGSEGNDYSYSDGVLTINNGANLTISTNSQTSDRIAIASGATATITLSSVNITASAGSPAIDIPSGSSLTLNLAEGSQNTLSTASGVSSSGAPGIHLPTGATLIIQGLGNLSVKGGDSSTSDGGAGIGGNRGTFATQVEGCGTVIILGGTVSIAGGTTSSGSSAGVGIGGGYNSAGGTGGAGGTVIILDDNVTVTGGIGGGAGVTGSGATGQGIKPTDDGNYTVYGDLKLPDGVTFPNGITINIPDGTSLTLPEGASWPENVTITGGGSISPKLTATITISANLDKTHDGSAVSLDSSNYTYTGDTTTPTIIITWHADNSGTIGNQLTDNAAPSAPGIYWVKVSAAETSRYAAAEATKRFTISQPLAAPEDLSLTSTEPSKATAAWNAVKNASGYSVQLYKDGQALGNAVSVSSSTSSSKISHTFDISAGGSYTFTVTATGRGAYSDSSQSSQSAALHTVSFDKNGGTGTIPMQLIPNGGTATAPAEPARIGYRFDGWYSDSNFAEGGKWTFATSTVTAATTLYAKWTAIDYEITITVQGGTGNSATASVNSITATSANIGDTVTLTATAAEDYHFVEWQVTFGGVTISEQNTFTMPAGAVAITAVFEEHTFTGWTANGNDTHTGTCSCGVTSTENCTYENGVCTVCNYVDVTTTDPASSSVKEGETATFTVTATGDDGDDISCQWQISMDGGSTWADIDGATSQSHTTQAATMDMDGYQYRCVVSNATGDSATSSAATLTLYRPVTKVELDRKDLSLTLGHTTVLTVTVSPDNATDQCIQWSSSPGGIVTIAPDANDSTKATITATGTGAAVITATAADGSGCSDSCTVTVSSPYYPVTGITLDQTSLSLEKGSTATLHATVAPAYATNPTVTWSSSDTAVATVDRTGTVTAVGGGTAVITAKAGSYSATCTVTVPITPSSTALTVAGRTTSSVTLSWDGVEEAEGYTIWYRSEYETEVTRKIIWDGDTTTWTKTGLEPGTKYFFAIRSWVTDADGKYVFSEVSPTQRGTTKPEAAQIQSVTVSNGYVKVRMAGEARGAKRYSICYADSRNGFTENNFLVGIRTSYTVRTMAPQLEPGTYYICVKSYRDLGNNKRIYGDWSNIVRATVR